jgi:hypothetical protein
MPIFTTYTYSYMIREKNAFKGSTILGGILLMAMAWYNGYPLCISDTGAYIGNGYEWLLPKDRPVTYSFFIRFFALGKSLFLPIFIQASLLWFLLYRVVYLLVQPHSSQPITTTWVGMLITVAFTPVSWFASQLSPDVFTAIAFFVAILFLLDKAVKKHTWMYLVIYAIALAMHQSNFISFLIWTSLLLIAALVLRKSYRKIAYLMGVTIVAILLMMTLHLVTGNGFKMSKSTPIFLLGKFCENGILKKYLEEDSTAKKSRLYAYKDMLPKHAWEFIWYEDSPLYKTGGWDSGVLQYGSLVKSILSQKKYIGYWAKQSIGDTYNQLQLIEIGEGIQPYLENTNCFWKVEKHYAKSLYKYRQSKQNNNQLPIAAFNYFYRICFIVLMVISFLLMLLFYKKISKSLLYIGLSILCICICNAFVTANLANVTPRLNARLIWIVPMYAVILTVYVYPNFKNLFRRRE